jgi:uncharacterized protein YbaP (TraB family)
MRKSCRSSIPLLLLVAACAAPRASVPPAQAQAQAAAEPRALLWEITRPGAPDKPLYLTGSIHVGRPDQFVFPPSFEAALARATALVVELDPDRVDPRQLQAIVLQLGVALPPAPGLSTLLEPETRALLPAALARVGLSPANVEPMKPWFLAMTLQMLELQKAGYSEKAGVDVLLLKRARGQKAIVELETMEEQMHVFADLPASVQDLMLRDAIREAPLTAVNVASMATAWEGGNADVIAELVNANSKDPRFAPMDEALIKARNRTMATKLAALLEKPETHFAVVGAGHVVGPEGIPALLAQKGLSVRQLPKAAK